MNLDLFKISDEIYALSDLCKDHLFKKIPDSKIFYYIDEALKIGIAAAEETKNLYENFDLRKFSESRKININIIDKEYRIGEIYFRAEIMLKSRNINIIMESVKQIQKGFGSRFSFEQIVDIHIAHELYHFIEYDKKIKTNHLLDKVKIFQLGPIKHYGSLVKTGEIAAHAFCKEILKLGFHPKAMDYQYMLNTKTATVQELSNYFEYLENILITAKNNMQKGV